MAALMRNAVISILLLALASCTHVCMHDYLVQPEEDLSPERTEAVFDAFAKYLDFGGYPRYRKSPSSDKKEAKFLLSSQTGVAGMHTYACRDDVLEMAYLGGNNFQVSLIRVHGAPGGCISEKSQATFVEQTEIFIEAASGVKVKLHLIEG